MIHNNNFYTDTIKSQNSDYSQRLELIRINELEYENFKSTKIFKILLYTIF